MYHKMCKTALLGLLVAFLSACTTPPKYVRELPPVDLLAECAAPVEGLKTNGQLAQTIVAYRKVLALCNIDKESLREWANNNASR